MAKPGPPAVPTVELERRGSWRAKTRPNEPKPGLVLLDRPPAWISIRARKHWKPIAEALWAMGVTTNADAIALGMLVEQLGVYIEARSQAADLVCESDKSSWVNPYHRVANDAWDRLWRAVKEFGMTPASRTGVEQLDTKLGEVKDAKSKFTR